MSKAAKGHSHKAAAGAHPEQVKAKCLATIIKYKHETCKGITK